MQLTIMSTLRKNVVYGVAGHFFVPFLMIWENKLSRNAYSIVHGTLRRRFTPSALLCSTIFRNLIDDNVDISKNPFNGPGGPFFSCVIDFTQNICHFLCRKLLSEPYMVRGSYLEILKFVAFARRTIAS